MYRRATKTSTAGLTYYFEQLESKRRRAVAELHLHPGRKGDLNNAGLKNKVSDDRAKLSGAQYQRFSQAITTWGVWKG